MKEGQWRVKGVRVESELVEWRVHDRGGCMQLVHKRFLV